MKESAESTQIKRSVEVMDGLVTNSPTFVWYNYSPTRRSKHDEQIKTLMMLSRINYTPIRH